MRFTRGVVVVTIALLAAGCTSGKQTNQSESPTSGRYLATIVRTTDGVPHITAPDLPSASFGQGWASAEDHACDLADQIVKIESQRAKWNGPGSGGTNVQSDFAWKAIDIVGIANHGWASQPTLERDVVTGFAKGWDASLAKIGPANVKGWCHGQPWLRPITAAELYAYIRSIALYASSAAVSAYLGDAEPPGTAAATPTTTATPAAFGLPSDGASLASNGWAIGSDRSADGGGLLLANPHFPWEGAQRFWEVQLTVPGQADVYGAQLIGVPGVGIGFTRHVAWTHTVSAGNRFTAYRLTLVPGDPTSYVFDGQPVKMTSKQATIQVKQPDGSTSEMTRSLWSSRQGPILDFPGVGWSATSTIALRDANLNDDAFLPQYLAMDRAESMSAFQAAHRRYQGVPLFNTIAVDDKGDAWYADTSATPNLSQAAIDAWTKARETDPLVKLAYSNGAVLLDGSTSQNDWVAVKGARDPGLVPYSKMPMVERHDYVFNANDSFWVPNATHFLTGDYSPLHGLQNTVRSWRTRENAMVLDDTSPTGPSGPDGKFTLDEVTNAALLNEASTARDLKDQVVAACATVHSSPPGGSELTQACSILAAWNGRFDVNSVGAVLWREFLSASPSLTYAVPFDPAKPIDTPNGVADPAQALQKLGAAIALLDRQHIPLDATLGSLQHDGRVPPGPTRISIGGGTGSEGVTNVVGWSSAKSTLEPTPASAPKVASGGQLTTDGYPANVGSSFIMAVHFAKGGPEARSILTYGETEDRSSPLFTVQMQRFADKNWKVVAFTPAEVVAQRVGNPEMVSGNR
jgi:acyl-homoserine-lactone acylase